MKLFLSKFLKAFVSGGVAAVVSAMTVGISFRTLEEGKHAIVVLAIAFASGAFHGLWNMYFPTTSTPAL